jgi:hypothetical protein
VPAYQVQRPEFKCQYNQKEKEKKERKEKKKHKVGLVALRKLMQKDYNFESSLGYIVRPYLKKIINYLNENV